MKQFYHSALGGNRKGISFNSVKFYLACLIVGPLLFAACKKDVQDQQEEQEETHALHSESGTVHIHRGLSLQTKWELLQARAATARYRNIKKAIADGYADIGVVVPNMGHHYMKSTLVDDKFEVTKPEILVYHKKDNGKLDLVAVEYAVPIELTWL